MKKLVFRGAGYRGTKFIQRSIRQKRTTVNGATWPFVKLAFEKDTVTFSYLNYSRTEAYKDIKYVDFDRYGYVVVHTATENGFGFSTVRLSRIANIFRDKGVNVINANRLWAEMSIYSQLLVVVIVLTLIILRP